MSFTENRRLHFIGICGKAMGGIAAALAREGWTITGSDEAPYSPMKEFLRDQRIQVLTPYRAENIPADVRAVIVGKRVLENNPELVYAIANRIPYQSFPEFLHQQFLTGSRNAVVAGGVGKTTTTAMLSWILEANEWSPDYLVGGLCRNLSMPARFSNAEFAVLEGDEYSSCFDDSRPKFLHYNPEIVIVTNIIEDHPDIYSDFEDLVAVFGQLAKMVPRSGCMIFSDDEPAAALVSEGTRGKLITVGINSSATERITNVQQEPDHSSFRLMQTDFRIPLCGSMNIRNAAMAAVAAAHWGLSPLKSADALRLFQGVRNRQEEEKLGSLHVIYDKASHPFALTELAKAVRQRFPERRLVSIIQPRATGGKDWIYQRDLPKALSNFDKVILTGSYEHNPQRKQSWIDDPFCIDSLLKSLSSDDVKVTLVENIAEMQGSLSGRIFPGDVIVISLSEQSVLERDIINDALRQIDMDGKMIH